MSIIIDMAKISVKRFAFRIGCCVAKEKGHDDNEMFGATLIVFEAV